MSKNVKQDAYDKELIGLVEQIKKICESNNLSYHLQFVFDDTEVDGALVPLYQVISHSFNTKDNEIILRLIETGLHGYVPIPHDIAYQLAKAMEETGYLKDQTTPQTNSPSTTDQDFYSDDEVIDKSKLN